MKKPSYGAGAIRLSNLAEISVCSALTVATTPVFAGVADGVAAGAAVIVAAGFGTAAAIVGPLAIFGPAGFVDESDIYLHGPQVARPIVFSFGQQCVKLSLRYF